MDIRTSRDSAIVFYHNLFMEKYPYTSTATDLQHVVSRLTEFIQKPISESRYQL